MPLNPVQQLHSSLVAQLSTRIPVPVEIKLDVPDDKTETWYIDVWGAGRHVSIEWRASKPHRQDVFGIGATTADGVLVESSEWLSLPGTVERVIELICEGDLGG